jgi:aerobic carbon-monoxide dehydrogenase medium subunit
MPGSVAEALAELAGEDSAVVGGGTSVALLLKSGLLAARRLVYLGRIPELAGAGERPDGTIRLGATVTLHQLCRSPLVAGRLPVLVAAAARVGNPRVRAVATIGGTVAHADPRQDLLPVLLALDARIGLVGPAGARQRPLAGFIRGFMETELADDELIAEVTISPQPGLKASYARFNPGSGDDFPTVSVAAAVTAGPDGIVRSARIALGAVGPAAILAEEAAGLLAGRPLGPKTIAAASAAAAAAAQPWADRHGSAQYKRDMVEVWTKRALESCAREPGTAD